jgi:hypothetical protein
MVVCAAENISPRVPSTCAKHAILSILFKQIIPSRQIDVAIDNQSFVPPVSSLTTSSDVRNSVHTADIISHDEYLQ